MALPRTRTILVVDDEDAIRRLVASILRQGGYGVLEAADYETAIDMYQRHQRGIDLLLTDVSLSGSNGCELAANLRRRQPRLEVLFMSGLSVPELDQFTGGPHEVWRFLQKPFGVTELLGKVQQFLELAGPTPA